MYDILLKSCQIVDGSGKDSYLSDLAIKEGKIVKIETNIEEPAKEIIDVNKKYVTPGFIDIHRHSDANFFKDNFGEIELRQGITTSLNGNCGLSLTPCPDEKKNDIFAYLKPITGSLNRTDFETFSQYYKVLEKVKTPINFGSHVGNGTIRMAAKGFENGKLTKEEISKAQHFLVDAIQSGAFGVSMGIAYMPEHNYNLEDFIEVLQPIKNSQIPIVTHIRGEGDLLIPSIKEVISIAKALNIPLHISHYKCVGKQNWGHLLKKSTDIIDKARADGMTITCDVYPYTAGSTQLVQLLPPEYLDGGMKKTTEILKNITEKEKIKDILKQKQTRFENLIASIGWESIMITSLHTEKNQKYIGMRVTEIAKLQSKDPYDCAFDLLVEENCDISMVNFIVSDEDIDNILKYKYSCIISDSIYPDSGMPHPRLYGAFTKILCDYVRDREVLTLTQAIRKMTHLPAKIMNIKNRGLIKEDYAADLAIFDMEKLENNATYTNPKSLGKGFDYVIVNGVIAVENDVFLKTNSGGILKKGIFK